MHSISRILIPLLAALCLWPAVPSAIALLAGVAVALTLGNPYLDLSKKLTPRLPAISIVGIGFGMNLLVVMKVGYQGIGYTVVGIGLTFLIGLLLGRLLKVERDVSLLIIAGTAICGGSAIAAVSSVIRAKSHDITVALGTVFLLNAVALAVFPELGHQLGLSESQFGLWAALAIHDTSSVVGAAMQYGPQALEIATTVKLARALWIVPMALAIGLARSRGMDEERASFKKPWFILGFVLAAAFVTWVPAAQPAGHIIEMCAKRLFVVTLFLIGTGFTLKTLKSVGVRPFVQGILLWLVVSGVTVAAIFSGWVSVPL